jgi:adenosylhomocysteinase
VVSTRIEWVREHCRLLRAISAEFRQTRPFDGLTIGTGIHLEAKTVALLLTLRDGGAKLVSTGNLNTTQPDAVAVMRADGITSSAARPATARCTPAISARYWRRSRT